MCFLAGKTKQKIATTDIVVYKKITTENTSIVFAHKYKPNTFYSIKKKLMKRYEEIERGFHSYREIPEFVGTNEKIVQFTIPRGAAYYMNASQYVSTSIRSGDLQPIKISYVY